MPVDERMRAQHQLILDNFGDAATYPAADQWDDIDDIDYLYRKHAILGISDHCIATYPGDLAQAFVSFALEPRDGGERNHNDGALAPENAFDVDHAAARCLTGPLLFRCSRANCATPRRVRSVRSVCCRKFPRTSRSRAASWRFAA